MPKIKAMIYITPTRKKIGHAVKRILFFVHSSKRRLVFCFLNDCLEGLRLIHCEVSEYLAVDLDTCFLERAH